MSASFRITGLSLGCLLGGLSWCLAVEGLLGGKTDQLLEIRSLSVNGKPISLHPGKKLRMSPAPRNVAFGFGTATKLPRAPLRVRYKLDGFDDHWREVSGDLSISFRFIDANQDPVSENAFRAAGTIDSIDCRAFIGVWCRLAQMSSNLITPTILFPTKHQRHEIKRGCAMPREEEGRLWKALDATIWHPSRNQAGRALRRLPPNNSDS